jgi:hypothetical protein
MNHYFADDGNYGDANGLVVIDTALFTDEDWTLIEEASDWQRASIARDIALAKIVEQD